MDERRERALAMHREREIRRWRVGMAEPGGWFRCRVVSAGPADDGVIYIQLTEVNGAWTERWFGALEEYKREMLATALTAMSTGYTAQTELSSTDEYSVINRLYVTSSPPPPPPPLPPPPTTTVPRVLEEEIPAARDAIEAAGLVARVAGSAPPSGAWVSSQSPVAETVVNVGSTVTLQWQTGPRP
jgi:hypothetical protein